MGVKWDAFQTDVEQIKQILLEAFAMDIIINYKWNMQSLVKAR